MSAEKRTQQNRIENSLSSNWLFPFAQVSFETLILKIAFSAERWTIIIVGWCGSNNFQLTVLFLFTFVVSLYAADYLRHTTQLVHWTVSMSHLTIKMRESRKMSMTRRLAREHTILLKQRCEQVELIYLIDASSEPAVNGRCQISNSSEAINYFVWVDIVVGTAVVIFQCYFDPIWKTDKRLLAAASIARWSAHISSTAKSFLILNLCVRSCVRELVKMSANI